MALLYTYPDEYLSKRVTEDRESRAIAEVATQGITDTEYLQRLYILKTYIITSLECSSNNDDNFAAKYKIYSKEYDNELSKAIANEKVSTGGSLFSVDLGRN